MELHKCVIGVTGEAIAGDILVKLKYWQWQLEFFKGRVMMKPEQWQINQKVQLLALLQSNLKHSTHTMHHIG